VIRRGLIALFCCALAPLGLLAQAPGGRGGAAPPPTPRAGAPVDLTGYWVSMITDDWRYRMLTPPKGNVDYLPITPEGRRLAEAWDPAKDEAAGEQCRAYGAIGVMRLPGRLHITWESDTVMKLETDAGTQTRRFQFGPAGAPAGPAPTASATAGAAAAASWQGMSTARWAAPINRAGGPGPGGARQGELRVVTTRMRPGYVRKNGIPYSGDAVLNEYFVRLNDDDGTAYMAVTQMVDDATYFNQPIVRTLLFRKQADAAGWNPTPCSAR